jgi:hypothetical protein
MLISSSLESPVNGSDEPRFLFLPVLFGTVILSRTFCVETGIDATGLLNGFSGWRCKLKGFDCSSWFSSYMMVSSAVLRQDGIVGTFDIS